MNTKFNENPSSGRKTVPCGQTDRRIDGRTDGQTDDELIIDIRNYSNVHA
jgi:hypothetical protein